MRILLIKTSSLGDIVHCFDGLLACYKYRPDISFDWVVEEPFKELPTLLPNVHQVITTNIRQWRKQLLHQNTWREIAHQLNLLKSHSYPITIDAQGLMRSAILGYLTHPECLIGYGKNTIKEPLGRYFYNRKINVASHHKPAQFRLLLSEILSLPYDQHEQFFLEKKDLDIDQKHILFFPNTSQNNKKWSQWQALAIDLINQGYTISVLNGSNKEFTENKRQIPAATHIPPKSILETKAIIEKASLCIGVDTGLTHLACILKKPCISLFIKGVTSPDEYAIQHSNHIVMHQPLDQMDVKSFTRSVAFLLGSDR